MPTYYYFIVLLGLCSFFVYSFAANFGGSNFRAKTTIEIISALGYLSFFALLIVMFFKVTWWHPIVIFAVSSMLAGALNFFSKNLVIAVLSSIGVFVFGIMAWIALL